MAENVMLAKKWTEKIDPKGWLMSEKYDGVRFWWNPVKKTFTSRNGKPFTVPEDIIRMMPNIFLDGELWEGYGMFKHTSGIVRRTVNLTTWKDIKLMLLDDPMWPDNFVGRYQALKRISIPEFACVVRQTTCSGLEHLKRFEQNVISRGGEGVMLKHPESPYEYKRSSYLLKVKRWHEDEAVVTGYQPGLGKHAGRMGALICTYKGQTIYLGTGFTDEERENPPEIDAGVTFKYFEMSEDNVPRFPVFKCVRNYE